MNNYYENHLRSVTKLVGYSHLVATLLNTHAAQLEKEKFLPLLNTHSAQLENEKLLPTSKEVKVMISIMNNYLELLRNKID